MIIVMVVLLMAVGVVFLAQAYYRKWGGQGFLGLESLKRRALEADGVLGGAAERTMGVLEVMLPDRGEDLIDIHDEIGETGTLPGLAAGLSLNPGGDDMGTHDDAPSPASAKTSKSDCDLSTVDISFPNTVAVTVHLDQPAIFDYGLQSPVVLDRKDLSLFVRDELESLALAERAKAKNKAGVVSIAARATSTALNTAVTQELVTPEEPVAKEQHMKPITPLSPSAAASELPQPALNPAVDPAKRHAWPYANPFPEPKPLNIPFLSCGDQQSSCVAFEHPEICCPVGHTCHESKATNSRMVCCHGTEKCGSSSSPTGEAGGDDSDTHDGNDGGDGDDAQGTCPDGLALCPANLGGGCCAEAIQCSPHGCLLFSGNPTPPPLTEVTQVSSDIEVQVAPGISIAVPTEFGVTVQVGGEVRVTGTAVKGGEVGSGSASRGLWGRWAGGGGWRGVWTDLGSGRWPVGKSAMLLVVIAVGMCWL
jgi:hypothetical protein